MAVTETGHLASREVDGLYRRYVGEIYRYAFAVLGNHADAEDVTQTTFLNAYRSLEQGVRPRKPSNWLLAIASNAIKQRFRQEQTRPRLIEFDERITEPARGEDGDDGPSVGELLAALSKIPPQQRQAIVLREFEGRSYAEIAEILGVTTTALETLLFRARRSLAEELEHQLTCTEAQLAISRAVDGRIGRKERRRLREHIAECPDCAHFARLQQRHRRALKGLMLVPIPLSLTFFKGFEGTAAAATLSAGPTTAAVGAAGAGVGTGVGVGAGVAGMTGGGFLAGGVALKAAAVVTAAAVAGGVAVAGSSETGPRPGRRPPVLAKPGQRIGQESPRGILVPGDGVARGKTRVPGQTTRAKGPERARAVRAEKGSGASPRAGSTYGGAQAHEARTKPRPSANGIRKPKATRTERGATARERASARTARTTGPTAATRERSATAKSAPAKSAPAKSAPAESAPAESATAKSAPGQNPSSKPTGAAERGGGAKGR